MHTVQKSISGEVGMSKRGQLYGIWVNYNDGRSPYRIHGGMNLGYDQLPDDWRPRTIQDLRPQHDASVSDLIHAATSGDPGEEHEENA